MQNKQKIKLIVSIVIVIVLGIYFFVVKNTDNKLVQEQVDLQPDSQPNTVDQNGLNKETSVTTEFLQPNKKEFNIAMSNAREAFIVKDYEKSLAYYNEALSYNKSDSAYAGMYTVYTAQSKWINAIDSLSKAIEINPSFTDYWKWKLDLMDQKTTATFLEIQKIYQEGLKVVNSTTKVNLVTTFARIAENNNEKNIAISTWKEAIKLQPEAEVQFQAEITRLSK